MASISPAESRSSILDTLQENRFGLVWLILAILAALPLFWYGLSSLGNAWMTPEYSHGPLIPVLSAFMFLREMKQVPPVDRPIRDRWPGVIVIAVALCIALLGNLVQIPDIVTYGFILWVGGLILTSYGWSRGLLFWTGVLHLVYMLPLPQFIYWQVTIALQFVSSELGVWFVKLLGVPVYLEGNVIDLGNYKLQVAEACSGLRYLFPILSFSYVFCVLYRGPVWHKVVLLVSAAPITVFMNSVRIGITGYMVDRYGIEQAEGFLHYFEGWVIFGICVFILFGLATLMQQLQRNPKPLGETIDLDTSGMGGQLRRAFDVTPSAAMIAAAIGTAILSAAYVAVPTRGAVEVDREPFALFPRHIGEWAGTSSVLDAETLRVLGADDYTSNFFAAPGKAAGVDFYVAYYDKLSHGSGIHSPEVCIPTSGWEMSRITQETLNIEGSGWAPFEVNRAIIEKGLNRQLVYYWFEQRGRRITNDYVAKFYTVVDGLMLGRTDGALVRVITPIGEGEDAVAEAEARLQGFLVDALPVLPRFVPEANPSEY